jgi:hypothetical protein
LEQNSFLAYKLHRFANPRVDQNPEREVECGLKLGKKTFMVKGLHKRKNGKDRADQRSVISDCLKERCHNETISFPKIFNPYSKE